MSDGSLGIFQHIAWSPSSTSGLHLTNVITKRSQGLRCYRRRHEYSKTRGSRVNGRRSTELRREWSGRHFMNWEPLVIERTDTGPRQAPPLDEAASRRPRCCCGSGRGGSDAAREHGGAQEMRSLPSGTSWAAGRAEPSAQARIGRPSARSLTRE